MPSVLIICTSATKLSDGTDTGSWAEEVAEPWFLFKEAGFEVTIASINGGEVPMDEASLGAPFATKTVEKFLLDDAAIDAVTNSKKLSEVKAADYDAVFLPGGHGVVVDLVNNAELDRQLSEAWAKGRILSAVCHGPNGLVGVKDAEGNPVVKGRKVTGFSNKEEYMVVKEKLVPFLLEDKLKELGGIYSLAPEPWAEYAVADGKLITGQNPGSSKKVAELIVAALS